MTTSPDPRLAALRALAEKATPGEWHLTDDGRCVVFPSAGVIVVHDPSINVANADFIAAANPAVVLSLLDALAVAEGRLAAAEGEAARWKHGIDILAAEHAADCKCWNAQIDALAARLSAAEARLEVAERVIAAVRAPDTDATWYRNLGAALRAYDKAGVVGEGRGT